ncbi:MAG TPA: hypothetical protein PKC91_14985, partial [Ignavibacteria bacterium]|nr:hypothetical protein [Ignavibacteria bacterium]
MKKLFFIFTIILAGYFVFTGQKNPDNAKVSETAPPIWNIHKLMKWYSDRGLTPPQYVATELTSKNNAKQTDAGDAPDVRVFPSSNPQSENSIAISELNPQNLFISTNITFT